MGWSLDGSYSHQPKISFEKETNCAIQTGISTCQIPKDMLASMCSHKTSNSLTKTRLHVCAFVYVTRQTPEKGSRSVYLIQIDGAQKISHVCVLSSEFRS